MISRRHLLAAGVAPLALLADRGRAFADYPNILLSDPTVRTFGPVLFVGDSMSSRTWRDMAKQVAGFDIGPFRLDLQPGRVLSGAGGWGQSGVEAVRNARRASFDPQVYVIALGVPSIVEWSAGLTPARTVSQAMSIITPLLEEIGADRTVGFLNLFARTPIRTAMFNQALRELALMWPKLHIVDWASAVRPHQKRWLGTDGYHPNYRGSIQRTRLIAGAMINMVRFESHS